MKEWYNGLESRERLLVVGGAVILLLLILYTSLWEPFFSNYRALKTGVEEQQKTLVWMQEAAARVQVMKGSSPGAGRGLGGRSLLAVVDQSARSSGLGESIKRLEPDGRNGAKLWLEGVSFDDMILWLGKLTRTWQVQTSVITIDPKGDGRVDARLTLLEPAA